MLQYWLWLASLTGLGSKRKLQILNYFGTPELAFYATRADFAPLNLRPEQLDALTARDLTPARQILDVCACRGVGILTYYDTLYSQKLRNIDDAPLVLYYKGAMPPVDTRPSLGVVGTRKATDYGLVHAKRFGYQLSAGGAIVVSGCATGIDTLAMKGALTAGMPVIGVLGCGVDLVYPPQNEDLFEDIRHYGCLISAYAPGTPPLGANFPRRNRIISGLSDGVVVIEAPKGSGALITADYAARQGRDVFALPGSVDAANSFGPNSLIREGATLVENGAQVLEEYLDRYHLSPAPAQPETVNLHPDEVVLTEKPEKNRNPFPKNDKNNVDKHAARDYIDVHSLLPALDEDQKKIVLALQDGPQTAENLAQQLGLQAANVLSALTILQIQGYADREPDNHFRLAYREK